MDVFAVRAGVAFAKAYAGSGAGPLFIEFNTYRYHGHSMSDPGTTYRDREEIRVTRETRDPIELLKRRLLDSGAATEAELKDVEVRVRKEVAEELAAAKAGNLPPAQDLIRDVLWEGGKPGYPEFIRMPDYAKSAVNGVFGAPH